MEGVFSYESKQKAIKKKLSNLASKTDILKKISKKENKQYDDRCEIARKVFYEAIEEYEEGDLTWDEMVNQLSKSLKVIK